MPRFKLFGGDKFKLTDVAKRDKSGQYVITPGEFYPAMIAHIRASVEAGDLPAELIDRDIKQEIDPTLAARRYLNWARRIPDLAWRDALVPLAVLEGKGLQVRIAERAEALECARLWFTRAAKNFDGGLTRIRILCDPAYKLGTIAEYRA